MGRRCGTLVVHDDRATRIGRIHAIDRPAHAHAGVRDAVFQGNAPFEHDGTAVRKERGLEPDKPMQGGAKLADFATLHLARRDEAGREGIDRIDGPLSRKTRVEACVQNVESMRNRRVRHLGDAFGDELRIHIVQDRMGEVALLQRSESFVDVPRIHASLDEPPIRAF